MPGPWDNPGYRRYVNVHVLIHVHEGNHLVGKRPACVLQINAQVRMLAQHRHEAERIAEVRGEIRRASKPFHMDMDW